MKSFKNLIGFIIFSLVFLSCKDQSSLSKEAKPKIAIAGLAIESSTFSPATSEASDVAGEKVLDSISRPAIAIFGLVSLERLD